MKMRQSGRRGKVHDSRSGRRGGRYMTAEAVSQEDGDRHKGVHEERQIEATGRKCRKEQVHESE